MPKTSRKGTKDLGGAPRTRHRWRIRFVLWGFLAAYIVVALRLALLQLLPGDRYSKEDLKHVGVVETSIPRGAIYDRNAVVLATDKTVYSLWADPRVWLDPENVGKDKDFARRVGTALGLPYNDVLEKLRRVDAQGRPLSFTWVKRWLAEEEVAELRKSDALGQGLSIRNEPLRFYPQRELASFVLGFCNLDRKGGEGIELLYDNYLTSRPGVRKSRKDARRNLLNSLTFEYREPEGGNDLYLTLDSSVQQVLEDELDKAMESSKAIGAMGMVMDPQSGAIFAMACRPAYNPNRFWEYQDKELVNRALIHAFEPGSSFKIVTASAALEEKVVTPDDPVNCENGVYVVHRHAVRDYHAMGVEPFSNCFAQSSNIAMIKMGERIGAERFEAWIRRFGFAQRTSRDFTREEIGLLRPLNRWSGLSMASLPMGQEIMVTMPQLARAFAVIANGGSLVEPYVVERAVTRDGTETYAHIMAPPKRILSSETAETMKQLCHLVTAEGTGERARIEGYRIGGKTGTAQIAKGGRYIPGLFTAIFAGFAPLDDPRVVAVIVVQEPAISLHFGGYICGPVFSTVVREALIRLNVPPDAVPEEPAPAEPAPVEADADTILADTGWNSDEPSPDAVLGQLDLKLVGAKADPSGGAVLPDLTGLTKSQASARIAAFGVAWSAEGAGWVVEQHPAPGTPLARVDRCRLVFSNERNAGTTENGNDKKPETAHAG